jgi:hypothetical protein
MAAADFQEKPEGTADFFLPNKSCRIQQLCYGLQLRNPRTEEAQMGRQMQWWLWQWS